MFFLSGVAKYLFVPHGEAVVFAMLASYFLSRTLVPHHGQVLLREHDDAEIEENASSRNPFIRFSSRVRGRLRAFFATVICDLLDVMRGQRPVFLILFLLFAVGSLGLAPFLGQISSPR